MTVGAVVRVLLDENLGGGLRQALSQFDPSTVRHMGWAGLKNGDLLDKAEASGFDVLITGDKTIVFEQNMKKRKIALITLSAPHWPLVKNYIAEIAEAITKVRAGSIIRIDCGNFRKRNRPHAGPSPG
jgi:hypothetical protein